MCVCVCACVCVCVCVCACKVTDLSQVTCVFLFLLSPVFSTRILVVCAENKNTKKDSLEHPRQANCNKSHPVPLISICAAHSLRNAVTVAAKKLWSTGSRKALQIFQCHLTRLTIAATSATEVRNPPKSCKHAFLRCIHIHVLSERKIGEITAGEQTIDAAMDEVPQSTLICPLSQFEALLKNTLENSHKGGYVLVQQKDNCPARINHEQ